MYADWDGSDRRLWSGPEIEEEKGDVERVTVKRAVGVWLVISKCTGAPDRVSKGQIAMVCM